MLWDSGSVKNDGEGEQGEAPITPILVPLQNKGPPTGKSVPLLVPDVQDLKDQFQQQQNMLTQIKETLKQNESQLSSKGKQVEVYANKLTQIRARSKNTQGKKGSPSQTLVKKLSKENLTKNLETSEDNKGNEIHSKIGRKGKVSELKKCLEENKLKFEQRAGKEEFETKKIESLVEQLKMQLVERDKTIQDLQKNIEQPMVKPESAQRKLKPKSDKEFVASKMTQTLQVQANEDSVELASLRNKIFELEATILDLRENLKEKESVIEARTQAVTLLSQDLSLKGKNTLENLEETRQEMRTMQNNFIAIEDELKKNLLERENRLKALDEKCKKLESTNFDLSLKNAEQQEKVVNLQEKIKELEKEKKSLGFLKNEEQADEKLEELSKKVNNLTKELDDRNKSMIKMKIEHKNKLKTLNKTLETLKSTSEEKGEIVRLSKLVEELLSVKSGLENRVAELEDEKVTEKKLKDQINELELTIKKQNEEIAAHVEMIASLEKENSRLVEGNESLRGSGQKKGSTWTRDEVEVKELSRQLENLEKEHKRKIEDLKSEHSKEIQMIESYYNSKVENLDKKELEEFRISTEINNIHVEEQIELLIREKQQLLEKLKNLSGVSSTDSLTFEKMEHFDLRDDKEVAEDGRPHHLENIVSEQELMIADLQRNLHEEKEKVLSLERKAKNLEVTVQQLESHNATLKQQLEVLEAEESGKSQKSNVNYKNRLKKVEMELSETKKIVEKQQEKLLELSQKLEEKEELIKNYTERIELFEKDDWDRQNHWKNSEDDIETVQELQKKCLSLENSLIELNEDCERLRKENIEIVHLLSEEKVKRKKLLEQMQAGVDSGVEGKIYLLDDSIKILEEKINNLQSRHSEMILVAPNIAELQGKLEWANVVITGKETEIFRLQNLLEDRDKVIEIMESDLCERKTKMEESERELAKMKESLKAKEVQLEEISANFDKLQECVDVANEKTSTNETQLKELLTTVKEMEGDVFRKESELQEIKGILAEKNLDMSNLRNRLEEVNSDLTYSYQEHLENMGKCLRDKESECEALLAEKINLEDANKRLTSEKEIMSNQKMEILKEIEKLKQELMENRKVTSEVNQKLGEGDASKPRETEELKIKMKKLAANLKKKAQNEVDLQKQIGQLQECMKEKDLEVENLRKDVAGIIEKWTVEKSEKEKARNELSKVLTANADMEEEKAKVMQKLEMLTQELNNVRQSTDEEIARQVQSLNQVSGENQNLERKVADLEKKFSEKCEQLERVSLEVGRLEEEKQTVLGTLAEVSGKYEENKFKLNEMILEKGEMEKKLNEVSNISSEYSYLDAKIQENMAVIESLEAELEKTRNLLKTVEEKLFYSEERRMSLENKNEELCKKIMEDSQTLVTIDDLSMKIEEVLKSEKLAQDQAKNLEAGNAELKVALDQVQTEKFNLDLELKCCLEKINEMHGEIERLKQSETDKMNYIRDLTTELEKSKGEYKQISQEFVKLNKDYEQFENDYKESLENSQSVEKTLKQKVEELSSENATLTEKYNALFEDKNGSRDVEEADKKPKKRKSVTFRTDEVEYIKDLKNQLHNYDARLKQANAEMENLKADLFREKLRQEVLLVVSEAEEKVESLRSTPEKKHPLELEPEVVKRSVGAFEGSPGERKFDATMFFGDDGNNTFFDKPKVEEPESLIWDDDWGADGHLEEEYFSGKSGDNKKKSETLELEIVKLRDENDKLRKESQEQMAKFTKALKKVKELKSGNEKLQAELRKMKSSHGFGDLDAAIVDELKCRIESMEAKEKEYLKSLEAGKLEKESLLKKIDVLNEGNEKFLEMKERQNNETDIWQKKNNELLKEISDLRQQLKDPQILDENVLAQENRELRNTVEALEWRNCELSELLEEKQEQLEIRSGNSTTDVEKVIKEKSLLQKEIDELNKVKDTLEKKLFDEEKKSSAAIGELNEQITALASENETLQDILGKIKNSSEPQTKLFDYFNSSSSADDDLFAAAPEPKSSSLTKVGESAVDVRAKETELNELRLRIGELEALLKAREEELNVQQRTGNEVDILRTKVAEIESGLKLRDGELHLLRNLNVEKENEVAGLRQGIFELESLVTFKDEELKRMGQELKDFDSRQHEFEDVNVLRQKIFQVEGLLNMREEELRMVVQTKDKQIEELGRRILELEDILRLKEEEIRRMDSLQRTEGKRNEVEELKRKMGEMEEFIRFKENEVYELQSVKGSEVQNLEQQIYEMRQADEQKSSEFHRLLCEKSNEKECVEQKLVNLETALSEKESELKDVVSKFKELEKSYNDSKLEIERLLNEEKLNSEEKFVEPFQKNIQIPVQFELEAMSRTLNEEKQRLENLKYELSEKDNLLKGKNEEILFLSAKIQDLDLKAKERGQEENCLESGAQLEKIISELQQELDTSNLQLEVAKRELEEFQKVKDEVVSGLKTQVFDLESELARTNEKYSFEISELKESEKRFKTILETKEKEESKREEELEKLKKKICAFEKDVQIFKAELESKENDIGAIGEMLEEERNKVRHLMELLEARESEVSDLRQTLSHLQAEITQFRNFENQVKELRFAQIQEAGAQVPVTPEGQPDLSDWTEHELAELSTRLQSDLDTALYMLHQRDVRCDELTFELMQLLEERDTLQLRLSTALRMNEELKSSGTTQIKHGKSESLEETKDLEDQSNDRQKERRREPSEDLRQLANKISELHSVSYLRDKTVKDESVQRHKEQMNLLSRVSDSDVSLGRDAQSSSGVLLNWVRGRTTPKVMHI